MRTALRRKVLSFFISLALFKQTSERAGSQKSDEGDC